LEHRAKTPVGQLPEREHLPEGIAGGSPSLESDFRHGSSIPRVGHGGIKPEGGIELVDGFTGEIRFKQQGTQAVVGDRIVRCHLTGAADQADGDFRLAVLTGVVVAENHQCLRIAGIGLERVEQNVDGVVGFPRFQQNHCQRAAGTLVGGIEFKNPAVNGCRLGQLALGSLPGSLFAEPFGLKDTGLRNVAIVEAHDLSRHADSRTFGSLAEKPLQGVRQLRAGEPGQIGGTGDGLPEVVEGKGNDHGAKVGSSSRVCRARI